MRQLGWHLGLCRYYPRERPHLKPALKPRTVLDLSHRLHCICWPTRQLLFFGVLPNALCQHKQRHETPRKFLLVWVLQACCTTQGRKDGRRKTEIQTILDSTKDPTFSKWRLIHKTSSLPLGPPRRHTPDELQLRYPTEMYFNQIVFIFSCCCCFCTLIYLSVLLFQIWSTYTHRWEPGN